MLTDPELTQLGVGLSPNGNKIYYNVIMSKGYKCNGYDSISNRMINKPDMRKLWPKEYGGGSILRLGVLL